MTKSRQPKSTSSPVAVISTPKQPKQPKQARQPKQVKQPRPARQPKPARQPRQPEGPEPERLQKLLARLGQGSRRDIDRMIAEGKITVNEQVAVPGQRVVPTDRIVIDGRRLLIDVAQASQPERRVIIYNKPEGEVTSRNDPDGRRTVFEHLPRLKGQRWIAVGRLDINTTGLLLFTTDGELANRLMHPSYQIDREYVVRVFGEVDDEMLKRLREGVMLEDGMAKFSDLSASSGEGINQWYHVTLMEGRNREVRRLWESQGLSVSRLKRVRFGPILLPSRLSVGRWELLEQAAVDALSRIVGLAPQTEKPLNPTEVRAVKRQQRKRPLVIKREVIKREVIKRTKDAQPATAEAVAGEKPRRAPAKSRASGASKGPKHFPKPDLKTGKKRSGRDQADDIRAPAPRDRRRKPKPSK